MNIVDILDHIEKVDTNGKDSNTRRAAMKDMLSFSKKVAAAAVPLGLGSMFSASAQTVASDSVVASLQFILTIKNFEFALISTGLSKIKWISPNAATDVVALNQIKDQESKHIAFLQAAITAAGKVPVAAQTNYDFPGGGTNYDVFFSNKTFMKVVQIVKDATIRAIKGQVSTLMTQREFLAAALAIQAVDARASSRLRVMRLGDGYSPTNRPWVNMLDETSNPGSLQLDINIYVGEDNVTQAGGSVTNINGQSVTQAQASQAFDEPFTIEQAKTAFAPFKVTF
jgi:hypothetical protein